MLILAAMSASLVAALISYPALSLLFFASFHHMVPMYTALPRWLAAW